MEVDRLEARLKETEAERDYAEDMVERQGRRLGALIHDLERRAEHSEDHVTRLDDSLDRALKRIRELENTLREKEEA